MSYKSLIMTLFILMSLSTAAVAAPYNYANLWMVWSATSREAYIDGVTDGIAEAYFLTTVTKPESPKLVKFREKLFVRDTRGQIADVITDLYKDPANAYIQSLKMFFIARDKIEGKDISMEIMEARKSAIENHKLNEKMKSK